MPISKYEREYRKDPENIMSPVSWIIDRTARGESVETIAKQMGKSQGSIRAIQEEWIENIKITGESIDQGIIEKIKRRIERKKQR